MKEYSPSLNMAPPDPTAEPIRTCTFWPGWGYAGDCHVPPPGAGPPCVYRMSPLAVSIAASRRARSAGAEMGVALVAGPWATAAITAARPTTRAAPVVMPAASRRFPRRGW